MSWNNDQYINGQTEKKYLLWNFLLENSRTPESDAAQQRHKRSRRTDTQKKPSKLGRKELLAHALGRTVIGGGMVHSQIALASKALEC